MNANLSAFLYLVAGVLFILSLRGLSSPASSRQGNFFGMAGMAIAVVTTLASHPPADGLGWLRSSCDQERCLRDFRWIQGTRARAGQDLDLQALCFEEGAIDVEKRLRRIGGSIAT